MTPEQIAREIAAQRYGQLMMELVAVLTDLNIAQQRIKALEEQLKAPPVSADVIPIKKE